MLTIPLQPVPSQTVQTQLDGQSVTINIYEKIEQGVFVDVISNGTTMGTGIIARDAVPLVAATYLGFAGNLIFADTQGSDDPTYTGLGSRFVLAYLTAAEYAIVKQ